MNPQIKIIHLCRLAGRDTEGHYVNTTSKAKSELSPMMLGPVSLYGGLTSQTVEAAWQFSKVYPEHVAADGEPNEDYILWSKIGWALTATPKTIQTLRYPMGKERRHDSLFHWWDGQKLGTIDARKWIYVPLYSELVTKTQSFQCLKGLWAEYQRRGRGTIYLMDFLTTKARPLKSGTEILNDPTSSLGHATVLSWLLSNDPALKECNLRLGTLDELNVAA